MDLTHIGVLFRDGGGVTMKRLLCAVLVASLFLPVFAFAEMDIKSLSTEELISLRLFIVQELMDRGEMKSVTVPAGEYIIGEDIPAGSYSVTTDQILVTLVIGEFDRMYVISPDSPIGKITLKEGDKIQFSSIVFLAKYAGLSFE